MAERNIRIFINSVRYEVEASLFSEGESEELLEFFDCEEGDPEPEKTQIKSLGVFKIDGNMAEVSFEETALTGMEGSRTAVSFDMRSPEIVTMLRTGSVSTALVFEKGKRHHCVYNTPYMTFEVCVHTLDIKNEIAEKGTVSIDYIVEIRGARAERTKFSMRIMD